MAARVGVELVPSAPTVVLTLHCYSPLVSIPLFLFWCCWIPLWPVIGIYLMWMWMVDDATNGKLRRRSEWLRRLWVWHYFAAFFPAQLHKTADLDPTRKYIFGYHPHGIISHGAWIAFATEALGFAAKFPGITNTLLTLDEMFYLPIHRDYCLAAGLGSVSKASIINLLSRGGADGRGSGRAVTIVIGGARRGAQGQPWQDAARPARPLWLCPDGTPHWGGSRSRPWHLAKTTSTTRRSTSGYDVSSSY